MGDPIHRSPTNRVLSVQVLVGRIFHAQGSLLADESTFELRSDQGGELVFSRQDFESTAEHSMVMMRLSDLQPTATYRLTAILPNGARITLFDGASGSQLAGEKVAAKLLPVARSAFFGDPARVEAELAEGDRER